MEGERRNLRSKGEVGKGYDTSDDVSVSSTGGEGCDLEAEQHRELAGETTMGVSSWRL